MSICVMVNVAPNPLIFMGARPGVTTRANASTSTEAAPARSSARAQASTVAPDVSTSSTSRSLRPRHLGLAFGRHAEGTLDILRAFGLAEPDLLRRGFDAFEGAVRHHATARRGDDLGQQRRLVEAPRPLPAPVQRHWNEGVGIRDEF